MTIFCASTLFWFVEEAVFNSILSLQEAMAQLHTQSIDDEFASQLYSSNVSTYYVHIM